MSDPVREYLTKYGPPADDPVESYLARYGPPSGAVILPDITTTAESDNPFVKGLADAAPIQAARRRGAMEALGREVRGFGAGLASGAAYTLTSAADALSRNGGMGLGAVRPDFREAPATNAAASLARRAVGLQSDEFTGGELLGNLAAGPLEGAVTRRLGPLAERGIRAIRDVPDDITRAVGEGLASRPLTEPGPVAEPLRPLAIRATDPPELVSAKRIMNERRAIRPLDAPTLRPEEQARYVEAAKARIAARQAPVEPPPAPEPVAPTPRIVAKQVRGRTVYEGGHERFRTWSDEKLLARHHELLDRLQAKSAEIDANVTQWSREDPNSLNVETGGIGTRSGTSITGAGGRAIGRYKDDGRLMDEVLAEAEGRGLDTMGDYERHVEQRAIAEEGRRAAYFSQNRDDLPFSLRGLLGNERGHLGTPGDLFGESRPANLFDDAAVGERATGAPQGMSDAVRRATALVNDPKEAFLAKSGKPSRAYTEAKALLARGEKIGAEELSARRPDLLGNERGRNATPILTGTVGAGLGATAGAKNDPEHPVRGALLGGAAGAVAGALLGSRAQRLGETGASPMAAEVKAPRKLPPEPPAALRQGPLRKPEETALRMANLPEHLQEEARSLGRTILGPGPVESLKQVEREGHRLVGQAAIEIDFTKGDRFHTIGAAELFNRRVDEAAEVTGKILAATTDAERAGLEVRRNALLDEATRLFSSISKSGTEAGRNLSARRAIAMRSNTPAQWEYEAMKLAKRPLSDAETMQIRRLLDEGKRPEMLRYIGTLRPTSAQEKAISLWKGFLLTNPATHAANTASNVVFGLTEEAARNPAAFADWLATKLIGGERTKTPTSLAILKASGRGALEGIKQVPDALRGLPTGRDVALGVIPHEVNYGHPIANAIFNGSFRALSVADKPFVEAAYRGSLAEQAKLIDPKRVAELIEHPSDEMVVRALQDAAVRTFRDQTPLGDLLHTAQTKFPLVGNLVVPFTKTPGAVATRFAEYTPYGFLKSSKLYRQAVQEAVDGLPHPVLKQRAAETFGRAATGTAPIALGALLYKMGLASGQTDKGDKSARDTRYLEGIPDNAVKVGGAWVEPNRLGPLGMLVSLGAVMAQQADKADGLSAVSGAAFGAARVVTDQPFLTGVESLLQAREGEDQAGRYLANLSGSLVPSIVSAVQRTRDPNLREAQTATDKIRSRIPGAADNLPLRYDQFGRPSERFGPGAQNLISPVRVTPEKRDPLLDAIRSSGAVIPSLSREPNESNQAYSDRARRVGQAVERNVRALVQSPGFAGLSPEDQKDQIENTVTRVRQAERRGTGRPERPTRPVRPMRPIAPPR